MRSDPTLCLLFDVANLTSMSVEQVMDLTEAELLGWVAWSNIRYG